MLYTTYLSNLKKVDLDMTVLFVVRFLPYNFNLLSHPKLFHENRLSPSQKILDDYHNTNDWETFKSRFEFEMANRPDLKLAINQLYNFAKVQDVCIMCYEKDFLHCHRYLLAQNLINKNIKWREIS